MKFTRESSHFSVNIREINGYNFIRIYHAFTNCTVVQSTVETKSTLKRDYTQQFSVELTL